MHHPDPRLEARMRRALEDRITARSFAERFGISKRAAIDLLERGGADVRLIRAAEAANVSVAEYAERERMGQRWCVGSTATEAHWADATENRSRTCIDCLKAEKNKRRKDEELDSGPHRVDEVCPHDPRSQAARRWHRRRSERFGAQILSSLIV